MKREEEGNRKQHGNAYTLFCGEAKEKLSAYSPGGATRKITRSTPRNETDGSIALQRRRKWMREKRREDEREGTRDREKIEGPTARKETDRSSTLQTREYEGETRRSRRNIQTQIQEEKREDRKRKRDERQRRLKTERASARTSIFLQAGCFLREVSLRLALQGTRRARGRPTCGRVRRKSTRSG